MGFTPLSEKLDPEEVRGQGQGHDLEGGGRAGQLVVVEGRGVGGQDSWWSWRKEGRQPKGGWEEQAGLLCFDCM